MADFSKLTELDKHHIFDAIDAQPGQLTLNFADSMRDDIIPKMGEGLRSVVMAGMGGSALAGNILRNWLYGRMSVPFEVVRGYDLPAYVGPSSLVIVSSHSGNTEESLSALDKAEKLNTQIVIMTAGGKLAEIAKQKGYLLLELPAEGQPRLNVFAGLKALACLLGDLGLVGEVDVRRELIEVANWLEVQKSTMSLDNDSEDNLARQIAGKLHGKVGLVYAGPALGSAAYKWKIDINENAKQLAFYNTYSELNHNEYQGWVFPKAKHVQAIQLESNLDNERIQKRMVITRTILGEHGFDPIRVSAVGDTPLQQLLYTILLGDYVSAYLGILNGIDPTPVEMVEKLKKELG
ncbi:bifunctional phosphoglucose/phosphomannose isomerase [bacterium]|nr:bifunctional phosphoglucose/phosphomannose isomerase [bacterium]